MYELRPRPTRHQAATGYDRLPLRSASEVREARRAGNRARRGFVDEFRCECARPTCRDTFPALAEEYRGLGSLHRFIVVPAHGAASDLVVAAADRFFVVEAVEDPSPIRRRRPRLGSEAA